MKYLPNATPLDPAEDPPGSIDPLGTLGTAERIAEVLFPGFTARMWRPRLLTFIALATLIAERVKATMPEREDGNLVTRLAFERIFVSAVVRQQDQNPETWRLAARRLPGSLLARRALRSEDAPLGRSNFLKGQAVNGPYGVLARLARNINIIDEEDHLGRAGEELLLAWTADVNLPGLLDDDHSNSEGRKWLTRFVKATSDHLRDTWWPSFGWAGWRELAEPLRPDNIGMKERRLIRQLLDRDPIRARCLELLCEPSVKAIYRAARGEGRSEQDQKVLIEAVLPFLKGSHVEEDRVIDVTIRLANAYEEVANHLETAFNCLLWGLTRHGGQAKPVEIESDKQLQPVFRSLCRQLPGIARRLRDFLEIIPAVPQIADRNPVEPLDVIATQAATSGENPSRLIEIVMGRHREVQASKGKGMWIEPGERLTLVNLPRPVDQDGEPPQPQVEYLHTFRVPNAYSFLAELGLSGLEVPDGEA